jgi:hypothetical protein
MASKPSAKSKALPSSRQQFGPDSRVLVAGGSVSVSNRPKSPLSAVVAQIKGNPALGTQLAKDAGIITSKGKLTKSYG